MYQPENIKDIFGETLYKYVLNKDRGGSSNRKGNCYENFFAIYKITEYSQPVLEENLEVIIKTQVQAFVDDLVIKIVNNNLEELQHYQLKNSSNISWGLDSDEKSICSDFKHQYILNQKIYPQHNCKVCLVISDLSQYKNLKSKIPNTIKKYSDVILFEYENNLIEIIKKNENFKQFIYYLSAFDEPETDKIETLIQHLIGAWCAKENQNISIKDFLEKVQKKRSSFIRSFQTNLDIKKELKDILDNIPDFKYSIIRGFFQWEYFNGIDKGTLTYDVTTSEFQKFESAILNTKPSTFDELENMGILI
ncbi:hypothetical protein [Geminocystis sp. NIES-3709]|uniref:hypothetical protein n=1 Tax=Geminocystis sp. NIES-3709 TaxID=1617448 RepID=UPI0005FC47FD|nr:hypothetical protein [Geminocystis sp. NIES-3709]BAQ67110.1 hypothetical protein GM3709_3875 [Geminocystis sp. NIES-3709]